MSRHYNSQGAIEDACGRTFIAARISVCAEAQKPGPGNPGPSTWRFIDSYKDSFKGPLKGV